MLSADARAGGSRGPVASDLRRGAAAYGDATQCLAEARIIEGDGLVCGAAPRAHTATQAAQMPRTTEAEG